MNSHTFHSSEKSRKEVAAGVTVGQVKDKYLSENCAFLTTSKRYFFFNQKPNDIICIHRTKGGSKETVNVDFDISFFASNPKNDLIAAASTNGDIAVIEVVEATDGTPCFSVKSQQSLNAMKIAAIALSERHHVAVLLEDGSILYFESGDVKSNPIAIRGPTPTAKKFLTIHASSLVVPLRDGIDIINLNTKKSHLTSSFVPHQHGTLSASVFDRWNGGMANETLLITLSSDSSEVRLWGMKEHGSMELKQVIALEGERPPPTRHIFIYENESKVLLTSYDTSSVIVLCADETAQQFRRITDWSFGKEPLIGASYYTRKIREGKGVVLKMTAVIRDSCGITSMGMPEEDIEGADNMGRNSGSLSRSVGSEYTTGGTLAASGGFTDTSRHFGAHTSSMPSTANSVIITSNTQVLKRPGATEITSIDKTSDIIIGQGEEFMACLGIINKDITQLKELADNTARSFQTQKAKDHARNEGLKSATTNAHTILNNCLTNTSGSPPGPVDPVTISSHGARGALDTFYDSLPSIVEKAAFTTCKRDMSGKMVDAMKRVSCDSLLISSLDKINLNFTYPEPHLVQKALNNQQKARKDIILRHGDDANNVNEAVVIQSEQSSRAAIKRSRDFLKAIEGEVRDLDRDVHEAISSIKTSHSATWAPPSTPGAFVEEAKALVAAGEYSRAVEMVTTHADSTYLVEFLQSEVVQSKRNAMIIPESLSVPVFVNLCTALGKDLMESPGQIPIRVEWLADMTFSRSDQLRMLKGGGDLYPVVSEKLRQVAGWLKEINSKDVDMKTRRALKQISLILGKV